MKALFLIFHGFDEANGISKKIQYQVEALKECGLEVHTCWLDDTNNHKRRMIDNDILQDYGNGFKGKILKRAGLGCIHRYCVQNKVELVYARSDHNTTPFLIHLYRRLQQQGIKVVMEIPTYPYDQEYKGLPFAYQRILLMDKCLRKLMARYINKIVTFSADKTIFNRPTIRIANGINFNAIPLKKDLPISYSKDELHLIAIATIHPWHGFDRAITGLANYYKSSSATTANIILHIVGQGVPKVIERYHELVNENNLHTKVLFHGPLFGEALNEIFNQCQIGIGSLARHRSGITHLRSLKNREYAARGIPFVYSEIDDDFEQMPYILKIPADETPLNINQVIQFRQSVSLTPEEIRNSIEQTLSWKVQMEHVIKNV